MMAGKQGQGWGRDTRQILSNYMRVIPGLPDLLPPSSARQKKDKNTQDKGKLHSVRPARPPPRCGTKLHLTSIP